MTVWFITAGATIAYFGWIKKKERVWVNKEKDEIDLFELKTLQPLTSINATLALLQQNKEKQMMTFLPYALIIAYVPH